MKKYISIILLTLTIAGSGCKKDFLSLETNPNTPSAASPDLLLAGALKTAAALPNSTAYTMYTGWMGYLAYSTGYQANAALVQYQITSGTYDVWTNYYLNISNFSALIATNSGPNYTAIAKIMTVFDYEALVDNYNNVPYSQALQGVGVLTPVYDNGSAIYDDLMVQLDKSITLIQGASSGDITPGPTADIMFKGNMTNWLKFANTLKLRLALRQVNVTAKTAALKAAVAATTALGYLDGTTAATVNPGYLNSDANGGQQSPLILAYGLTASGGSSGNNVTYQANAYSAHWYATNNDPRLNQIFTATTSSSALIFKNKATLQQASIDSLASTPSYVVVSTPLGSTAPPSVQEAGKPTRTNLSPSKYGPGVLKSQTMNANVLSSAEALFLQAEGVARGYIIGNATTLYNAGIAASFADDLVPSAASAAATYAAQPAQLYPAAGSLDQQVKAIIVQKWAALNLYGAAEVFHEFQRTGYPDTIPLSVYTGVTAPNQVTRIPYPAVEQSSNPANVAAQGTINIFSSKIFWAK